MDANQCISMGSIAMLEGAEYTEKLLVFVVFRGCGVVVTHQLLKAM
jgi:hypothetical protein